MLCGKLDRNAGASGCAPRNGIENSGEGQAGRLEEETRNLMLDPW